MKTDTRKPTIVTYHTGKIYISRHPRTYQLTVDDIDAGQIWISFDPSEMRDLMNAIRRQLDRKR